MAKLPKEIMEFWKDKERAVVLTTVSKEGIPNSIYATCVKMYDESTILIADNYFDKTKRNLIDNEISSVLFITKEGKSIQIKGKTTLKEDGLYFDDMKKWNPEHLPGVGVAVFKVEKAYAGAEELL